MSSINGCLHSINQTCEHCFSEALAHEPACRDTTFDGIVPERVWLDFNNIERKDYLTVTLSINGVKKVINEFYIPGLSRDEGITLHGHNLTWIFALKSVEQVNK